MIKKVQTSVTDVTIYRKGALVTREAFVDIEQGRNHLVFDKLSGSIIKESIQVITRGALNVLEVEYIENALKTSLEKELELRCGEKAVGLQEKVKNLEKYIQEKESEMKSEMKIVDNLLESTRFHVDSVNGLKEYLDYRKKEMKEFSDEIKRASEEKKKVTREYVNFQIEMNEKKGKFQKTPGRIHLDVEGLEQGRYSIKLVYYDRNASWSPFYDIKVEDISSPIRVALKGKVTQNTGEDWSNVRIKLSTGNVNISNNQPELKTWVLQKKRFAQPERFAPPSPLPSQRMPLPPSPSPMMPLGAKKAASVCVNAGETTILNSAEIYQEKAIAKKKTTVIEYSLYSKYNIADGTDGNIVIVTEKEFPAQYVYCAIPKAEQNVYLKAVLDNSQIVEFLECDANVFFENTFIGAVHILPQQMKDNFSISLGRDNAIFTRRNKLKDFVTEPKIGNNKKAYKEYEIILRNQKTQRIWIEIYDQIPVSVDASIVVEPIELSGAYVKENVGELKWQYFMEPNTEVKIPIKFAVSYPKNEYVDI